VVIISRKPLRAGKWQTLRERDAYLPITLVTSRNGDARQASAVRGHGARHCGRDRLPNVRGRGPPPERQAAG
jgi:hypothetical protein